MSCRPLKLSPAARLAGGSGARPRQAARWLRAGDSPLWSAIFSVLPRLHWKRGTYHRRNACDSTVHPYRTLPTTRMTWSLLSAPKQMLGTVSGTIGERAEAPRTAEDARCLEELDGRGLPIEKQQPHRPDLGTIGRVRALPPSRESVTETIGTPLARQRVYPSPASWHPGSELAHQDQGSKGAGAHLCHEIIHVEHGLLEQLEGRHPAWRPAQAGCHPQASLLESLAPIKKNRGLKPPQNRRFEILRGVQCPDTGSGHTGCLYRMISDCLTRVIILADRESQHVFGPYGRKAIPSS